MKQFLQFICILVISIQYSIGQLAPPARDSFQNPFSISLADPYVLYEDGAGYYMYGTGGGAEKGFSAYFSTDLVNWKYQGQVYFGDNENGWGTGDYWAPEVYTVKGRYYMFYSAQWKENPTNGAWSEYNAPARSFGGEGVINIRRRPPVLCPRVTTRQIL